MFLCYSSSIKILWLKNKEKRYSNVGRSMSSKLLRSEHKWYAFTCVDLNFFISFFYLVCGQSSWFYYKCRTLESSWMPLCWKIIVEVSGVVTKFLIQLTVNTCSVFLLFYFLPLLKDAGLHEIFSHPLFFFKFPIYPFTPWSEIHIIFIKCNQIRI